MNFLSTYQNESFSDSITSQYMVLKQLYPLLESKLRSYGQGDEYKYNATIGALNLLSGPFENFEACLLYTSPSPRDRTRSRMPSSA